MICMAAGVSPWASRRTEELRTRAGITVPIWPPIHPGWLRCSSSQYVEYSSSSRLASRAPRRPSRHVSSCSGPNGRQNAEGLGEEEHLHASVELHLLVVFGLFRDLGCLAFEREALAAAVGHDAHIVVQRRAIQVHVVEDELLARHSPRERATIERGDDHGPGKKPN